jgi:hypothetical protein
MIVSTTAIAVRCCCNACSVEECLPACLHTCQ